MKNTCEKIFEKIKEAKVFAKQNNVTLYICEESFINDDNLDVNDYPNDTEFMFLKYKDCFVNVYIGDWDSFEEVGSKWIDYDIYKEETEELLNDGNDIFPGHNVLDAATDISFYIEKIEKYLNMKEI